MDQQRRMLSAAALCLAGVAAAASDDPVQTDGDKYRVLLEDAQVRVLEYRDRPGDRTHEHRHPPFVLYAVAPFKRRIVLPGGKAMVRAFQAGNVMHSDGQTHIGENVGDTPTHAILVEMKGAGSP